MYKFIITDKHGKCSTKEFKYVEYDEAIGKDELDYYNLNDICNFEYCSNNIYSNKCPQNILSIINKFCKRYGELVYCIYGVHGVLAFIETNKKIPGNIYWRYNQYIWRKYNIVFDIRKI